MLQKPKIGQNYISMALNQCSGLFIIGINNDVNSICTWFVTNTHSFELTISNNFGKVENNNHDISDI